MLGETVEQANPNLMGWRKSSGEKDAVVTIRVTTNLTLWEAIKLRIGGIAYVQRMVEEQFKRKANATDTGSNGADNRP